MTQHLFVLAKRISVLTLTFTISASANSQEEKRTSDVLLTSTPHEGYLDLIPWQGARVSLGRSSSGLAIAFEDNTGAKLEVTGPFLFAPGYPGYGDTGRILNPKKAANDAVAEQYRTRLLTLRKDPNKEPAQLFSTYTSSRALMRYCR